MRASRALVALAIAVTVALAVHGTAHHAGPTTRIIEPLELTTLDWRMRAASGARLETPVVLVLFDSLSVETWPYITPFPRPVIADVVDAVAAAGARTIGLDVYLDRMYPELEPIGGGDERLRASIEEAGNVVLATMTVQEGSHRRLERPHPSFLEVSAGLGTADLPTPYETVRDGVLTVSTGSGRIPSFALALYAHYHGLDAMSLAATAELEEGLPIPGLPDRYARARHGEAVQVKPILFSGPPSRTDRDEGAFPAYSAFSIQMLGPLVPEDWFRDRIVLIGSGFHAEERFRTPFHEHRLENGEAAGWTYGVEVHAQALEDLITGRHRIPLPAALELALLAFLGAVVTLTVFLAGATLGSVVAAVAVLGMFFGSFPIFDHWLLHLPVVTSTLAVGLALLGSTGYLSVTEGREKRRIRGAFSKYVPEKVVAELVADPSRLRLGGEKREITVLFSDLAGFTSLSERLDPETLVSLLNRYLGEMTDIVMEENGTLDKYIGDAIMALYGAPVANPDHALHACRTAVRMRRALRELNARGAVADERTNGSTPPLSMRIGINTGEPVVGNIGGEKRFDYTALGDAVNLAARLEPACKEYGVDVLISETTRRAAGDAVLARELDLVAVYGRQAPVAIYELIGIRGEDELPAPIAAFERGVDEYRAREFSRAMTWFEEARSGFDGEDGPSEVYLERCRRYMVDPPPPEWDLVERRRTK